jgi:hypothetical protein
VERDYLEAMAGAVSLDDWREIVRIAVQFAQGGDDKARAWLSKHLLGDRLSLIDLAASDGEQDPAEADIQARRDELEAERSRRSVLLELAHIRDERMRQAGTSKGDDKPKAGQ